MPADIDQVTVGQPAPLKFSTFNSSITPKIHARVVCVSRNLARPCDKSKLLTAELEITDGLDKPGGRKLKPGMVVDLFITTEQRTAMSYLVKPLKHSFGARFARSESARASRDAVRSRCVAIGNDLLPKNRPSLN